MFVLNNEMHSYNTRNKDNIQITSHRIKVRVHSIKVYYYYHYYYIHLLRAIVIRHV